MSQPTIMESQYLLYIDDYQALICKICECAINETVNEVNRHFRRHHGKIIPLRERKSVSRFMDGLRVVAPKQLRTPGAPARPIEGLPTYLQCGPGFPGNLFLIDQSACAISILRGEKNDTWNLFD